MKKPTGISGSIRISTKNIYFKNINFPDAKEAIESFIMEKFVENTNKQDTFFKFTSFNQNKQNDFDFSAETTIGKNNIDLMEVAILDKGGYDWQTTNTMTSNLAKVSLKRYQENQRSMEPKNSRFFFCFIQLISSLILVS